MSEMENYFWNTEENNYSKKLFVLVIYDIIDNKRRVKFAKEMSGYGFRVQKSAFEALIEEKLFIKLKREIPKLIDPEEDSVRIYRMTGYGEVNLFGVNSKIQAEDVIVI
jgi:CRISPR-associated protein Cas2